MHQTDNHDEVQNCGDSICLDLNQPELKKKTQTEYDPFIADCYPPGMCYCSDAAHTASTRIGPERRHMYGFQLKVIF